MWHFLAVNLSASFALGKAKLSARWAWHVEIEITMNVGMEINWDCTQPHCILKLD